MSFCFSIHSISHLFALLVNIQHHNLWMWNSSGNKLNNQLFGFNYKALIFFNFIFFTEITAFSDRYSEFEKLNTEILGVSIDSVVNCFSCLQYILLHLFILLNFLYLLNYDVNMFSVYLVKHHISLRRNDSLCLYRYVLHLSRQYSVLMLELKMSSHLDVVFWNRCNTLWWNLSRGLNR